MSVNILIKAVVWYFNQICVLLKTIGLKNPGLAPQTCVIKTVHQQRLFHPLWFVSFVKSENQISMKCLLREGRNVFRFNLVIMVGSFVANSSFIKAIRWIINLFHPQLEKHLQSWGSNAKKKKKRLYGLFAGTSERHTAELAVQQKTLLVGAEKEPGARGVDEFWWEQRPPGVLALVPLRGNTWWAKHSRRSVAPERLLSPTRRYSLQSSSDAAAAR